MGGQKSSQDNDSPENKKNLRPNYGGFPIAAASSSAILNSNSNITKYPKKFQSNFLGSLSQNQNLGNGVSYNENIEDNKIKVNLKTNDLISFIRIQHEMSELKRRNKEHADKKKLIIS